MLPAQWQDRVRIPAAVAPMFIISNPDMIIAACQQGMPATFPALNQRSSEGFEDWLKQITEALNRFEQETGKKAAPFGVNLIVHKSNPRLEADLALCVKYKVPYIITSLGAVKDVVDSIHNYGGIVFHDVTTKRHAEKAAEAGVDGIIAVTAGAGGHAGNINPFALIEDIRSFWDKTLCVAGCINKGNQVRAAELMGADIAMMGTRFINTQESRAVPEYKQMIIESKSTDIIYTPAISGVNASFMTQSLVKEGLDPKALQNPEEVDFGSELVPDRPGKARAWIDIWSAGHGVSGIEDIPKTAELVDRLIEEYQQAVN